jgi:hypothetical protein
MLQRVRSWVGLAILVAVLWGTMSLAQERLPAPRARIETAPARFVPKFEALAETKLLMEGLAQPNFRSLAQALKKKPEDAEAWAFARGQSLLIAETGNLLLLRPPRNQGRDTWMQRAMDMRQAAGTLSRHLSNHDLEHSRTDLAALAHSCNRCHQTFRIKVRVGPDMAREEPEAPEPEGPAKP